MAAQQSAAQKKKQALELERTVSHLERVGFEKITDEVARHKLEGVVLAYR